MTRFIPACEQTQIRIGKRERDYALSKDENDAAKFDAYSPWQDCDSGQQMLVWSDWSFGRAAAHLWKKTRDQQMPVTIRIDQITHTHRCTHTHTPCDYTRIKAFLYSQC
jgi:hypothetical protein